MNDKGLQLADSTNETKESEKEHHGIIFGLVSFLAFAYSMFHIYTAGAGSFPNIIQRSVHVLVGVLLVYAIYKSRKSNVLSRRSSWLDVLFIILASSSLLYLIINYNFIMDNPASSTTAGVIFGWMAILLILEASRRVMGVIFPLIALVAIIYGFIGPYLPGIFAHRGFDYRFTVEHLYLSTYGIWGVTTSVTATTVAVFIIFGTLLMRTGGGSFYIKLALLVAGKLTGGPAKVAVIASTFFGMLSGSAPGNVAVTGNITIPTMIRLKYNRNFAGAVESVASTGGQLAPPIMGAGAFLMAEILGISYTQVMIAAIIPTIVYYFSVFYSVHVYSKKMNLRGMSKEELPTFNETITWYNLTVSVLPVIILLYFLFSGTSAAKAGFLAIISLLLIYGIEILASKERMNKLKNLFLIISESGRDVVMIAVLSAVADIVVGMLSLTGLGNKLSIAIVTVGENSGWILIPLFLAMLVALILGMGMPTTAAYVLASSTLAPTLIGLGFNDLATHMFIFYFAVLSAITPPVCAAVYVACGISKGDWLKTAAISCFMAIPAFFLPYLFISSQNLLLQGDILPTLYTFSMVLIGIMSITAGVMGYFIGNVSIIPRLLLVLSGILLFINSTYLNIMGVFIVILLIVYKKFISGNKGGKELTA